jgi:predicted Zn-dependent protease
MGAASIIGRDVRLERNASPVFAPRASLGHRQRDPLSGIWYMYLGFAEICRGRFEAAIVELKRALDAGYRTYVPYTFLAAAEAVKGNDAEAKLAVAEARRVNPQLTVKWFLEHAPVPPMIVEGLRKAGLPEE